MLIPFIWGIILLLELNPHPPGPGLFHRQLISSFFHLFPSPLAAEWSHPEQGHRAVPGGGEQGHGWH